MMQFEDDNSEGYTINDFSPDLGLYSNGALSQNQFANANAQISGAYYLLGLRATRKFCSQPHIYANFISIA
jgi:hypothetical protein